MKVPSSKRFSDWLGPEMLRADGVIARAARFVTIGFRKVVDATFMIGFLVTGNDVSKGDVEKYLAALRRAQMEIDLHPEQHKHYHLRAVPEKYHGQVDPRTFGTGERIVFLPYPEEAFAATQQWTQAHQIFDGAGPSAASYREASWA